MRPLATIVLNKDQLELLINAILIKVGLMRVCSDEEMEAHRELHLALEMASSELDC